jgi:hypothetical protein
LKAVEFETYRQLIAKGADRMKVQNILTIAFVASMLGACATTNVPVGERESVRQELNDRTDKTLALLLEKKPELQASLDTAVGYFVARLSGAQVAVIGGAVGMGVLYDKEAASRTYMNVTRYDLGLGAGAGAFRVVVLFQTRETLEQFRSGTWRSAAGAETAAGTAGAATPIALGEGSTVHAISESGAIVAATARLIRLTVNTDLTDVGVSEVSIPGRGFTAVDQQGDDAPRVWNRALPFLAQQVIDKGYELPLPYGIGLTYAHVDQEQILSDLEVGLNGGAKEPFPFVGFDNARSVSDSLQLKLDAWLFPFMNVFALFGRVDLRTPCAACSRTKRLYWISRPSSRETPTVLAPCSPGAGTTGSLPCQSAIPMPTWKEKKRKEPRPASRRGSAGSSTWAITAIWLCTPAAVI